MKKKKLGCVVAVVIVVVILFIGFTILTTCSHNVQAAEVTPSATIYVG